jgi:NTE family protein
VTQGGRDAGLITDVALYADQVELVVLPPLCPLRISATDFRHAAELARRADAPAASWLDSGEASRARPERILGLHGHPGRPGEVGTDRPA